MEEATGTRRQPRGRALMKLSASPPPCAPGPTTACPRKSAAAPILVKTPACPPLRAPSPTSVEPPASSPPRAAAPSLVKAPATPPQRAPIRRELSASPPPTTGHASWLLLDRFIHRSRRKRGVFGGDATTSEMSYDCVGRCIRVSLRIADPPLVSRLYLHWTLRPATVEMPRPYVIAAHRGSILFDVTVPFEDPSWWSMSPDFPIDYFVYSATNTSSSPPSLTRLPPCFKSVVKNEDKTFQPYRWQQQRFMREEDMGLFCHGDDGGFIVAELRYDDRHVVELCILHHSPRSSVTPMQWRVKKLQTPPKMNFNPREWTIDAVFPIDGFLCWVDYYHGMLLVNMLLANSASESSPDEQQLRYIALPKQALQSSRPYEDALSPDLFRHVSVTDAGIVKLVCILTKPSTFTIITWSFNIHENSWIKDCSTIMGDSEFFGLFDASQDNLPRVAPSFPVVSLADPDIIYFLLNEVDDNTYWVIEVNMRDKVLQSTALYIGKEEEEGYSPEKPRSNFYGQYFVRSRFSSYLGQDDFKSRKLSVLMEEKAKQRLAMQKGAQLDNLLMQKKEKQCKAKGKVTGLKNLPLQKKAKQCQAKGRRRK